MKPLIKAFEAQKVVEAKAARLAKGKKIQGKSKEPLIEDTDIQEKSDEEVNEDPIPLGKPKRNKHRKTAHIHRRK